MTYECIWTNLADEMLDAWETSCGNMFEFETGGPDDNGFIYCPYCGSKIAIADKESAR